MFDDADHIYVSVFINPGAESLDKWREELEEYNGDNFTIVSNYSNGWGAFSLVQATLDGMEHFSPVEYDYFINLSGQCYPLKTVPEIKSTLAAKPGAGYLECNSLPWSRWVSEEGGYSRIYRRWYKPFKAMNRMSFPRLKRELPLGMEPYGGSQWFCLTKEQVEYVLDVCRANPALCRFYQRTLIPDEHFFQTVLMNSQHKAEIQSENNLRFIDWQKKCVPLPAILLTEDLERMMSSGMLFARKFDPTIDSNVLDMIDRYLD